MRLVEAVISHYFGYMYMCRYLECLIICVHLSDLHG